MRNFSHLLLGFLCLSGGTLASHREEPGALLLKSVRVLDPESRTVTPASVLIRNGRIEALLDGTPESFNGVAIDLSGKYLLPAFLDMHVHSYGNGSPAGMPEVMGTEGVARRVLVAGVAGFLDLAAFEDEILELRNRQRSADEPAAAIYSAGTSLTCPGGHGTQFPNPAREVVSPEQARRSVAELAAKRPDVIKLIYIPSHPTIPSIGRSTMEAIVDEAKRHGIPTVAHIDFWEDAIEAVEAGVSAITHTSHLRPPKRLLDAMRRRGTYAIPTLAVHTELALILDRPQMLDAPLLRAVAHPQLLEIYRRDRSSFPAKILGWVGRQRERRAGYLDAVRRLARHGIPVLTGTDAGNPGTFQGYSIHREMWLLSEAGLTPWQVLAAATTLAGKFLGKRVGVREGDPADLVVLDESPLQDIRHTETIAMVIRRGRIVDLEALKVGGE